MSTSSSVAVTKSNREWRYNGSRDDFATFSKKLHKNDRLLNN